jgi:hypothetical protein
MYGTSLRENREIPCSPAQLIGDRPSREGQCRTPGMYECGKSDHLIVPTKPPNKAGQLAAEVVEERRSGKRSSGDPSRPGRRAG